MREQDLVFPPRTWKLVEIASSPEHGLTLEDWSDEAEEVGRSLDRHQESYQAAKSNVYELFGWSSVFQGVIIACIAQAQSLTCRSSFPLFYLSSLTIFGTLWVTLFNLTRLSQHKGKYLVQKQRLRLLLTHISLLREEGSDFNIAEALSQEIPNIRLEGSAKTGGLLSKITLLVNETNYTLYLRDKVGAAYGGLRYTLKPNSKIEVSPLQHTYFRMIVYAASLPTSDPEDGSLHTSTDQKKPVIDTRLAIDSDMLADFAKILISFNGTKFTLETELR